MKITDYRIEHFTYREPLKKGDANAPGGTDVRNGSLLFVETDERITGIAPGSTSDTLFSVVEGQDPRGVVGLWRQLVDKTFKTGHVDGIGALDMARWDLKAKANNEPLWRSFGAAEPRVKAYASGLDMPLSDEELFAFYDEYATLGVDGGKLKVGLDQRADIRRLGIVREALLNASNQPYLMIDANEFWSPKQAIRKVCEIEQHYDLTWVEEPARRWDYRGLRQVSRGVRTAVASGENLHQLGDYMPLIAHEAVDIVQFGSLGTPGFTGAMQLAHMARGFEVPVSVIGGPGNLMAHLACALPNHNMMEVKYLEPPPCWNVDNHIDDGWIRLGQRAGLGIEVAELKLKEMQQDPVDRQGIPMPFPRREGAGLYDNPPTPGETGWN